MILIITKVAVYLGIIAEKKEINNKNDKTNDPLEQFEIIPLGIICNGFSTFSFNLVFIIVIFFILKQIEIFRKNYKNLKKLNHYVKIYKNNLKTTKKKNEKKILKRASTMIIIQIGITKTMQKIIETTATIPYWILFLYTNLIIFLLVYRKIAIRIQKWGIKKLTTFTLIKKKSVDEIITIISAGTGVTTYPLKNVSEDDWYRAIEKFLPSEKQKLFKNDVKQKQAKYYNDRLPLDELVVLALEHIMQNYLEIKIKKDTIKCMELEGETWIPVVLRPTRITPSKFFLMVITLLITKQITIYLIDIIEKWKEINGLWKKIIYQEL